MLGFLLIRIVEKAYYSLEQDLPSNKTKKKGLCHEVSQGLESPRAVLCHGDRQ